MSWDRKLRKLIAEQTKPRITFKEFCEKHGIELPANYVAQTNTNEKVNVFALRVTSLCVLGVAAIIALMFVFIPKNNFQYYHDEMVKKERIKYEELLESEVPTLINFDRVELSSTTILKVTTNNDDIFLGYVLRNIIYGDESYAFTMTLIIRSYKGYLFAGYDHFDGMLENSTNSVSHKISESQLAAYIAAERNGYEYFITVTEFGGITPITKENIERLVQEIL